MKLTFRRFLLKEGGNATSEWGTERASPKDVKKVIGILAKTLKISTGEVVSNLLGTSRLTYLGKKSSSGDIDIAVNSKKFHQYHEAMMQLVGQSGLYNTGTKVGSYAVDVNGKKVQVDLMFVDSEDFAKFMYFSSEGEDSKYPGAVRNIMLMTLATHILKDGDFVIKDQDQVIAKAAKSLKLNAGLERLFKVAKKRKDGEGRVKSLEKVSPEELDAELKEIDPSKVGTFKKTAEIVNNPNKIAKYFFGPGTTAKDIMTAEQVASLINQKFKGEKLEKIKKSIKDKLAEMELKVPSEL